VHLILTMASPNRSKAESIDRKWKSYSDVLSPSLAHEINNPLVAILNLTQLLKSEVETEKGRHFLFLLEQEVLRVSAIAREGLGKGRGASERQLTSMAELIGSVLDLFESNLVSKEIFLKTRLDSSSIYVDSGQVRRVLCNLVLNAIYALQKGGRLEVRSHDGHEWTGVQREGIRVTVGDNGSGIRREQMNRIFEPFFTTKGNAGTGLGLTLVHDIVQKHTGTIRVRSSTKAGRCGTTFMIFLPYSSFSEAAHG
jgi:signal transduction histidine kinase